MRSSLWPDLESLFGSRGACNGCWCMYWRIGPEYHKRDRALNKEDFKAITSSHRFSGLVAYLGDKPVGWCQLTGRDDLPWLLKNGYGTFNESTNAWSISCFYIRPGYRKKGITSALVNAAPLIRLKREAQIS